MKSIQTPHDLLLFLTKHYRVDIGDVRSSDRHREIVKVRQLYCYFAYTLWPWSKQGKRHPQFTQQAIAREINRNYSTVSSSVVTVLNDIEVCNDYEREVHELYDKILELKAF